MVIEFGTVTAGSDDANVTLEAAEEMAVNLTVHGPLRQGESMQLIW
jgi:hypothetical protein